MGIESWSVQDWAGVLGIIIAVGTFFWTRHDGKKLEQRQDELERQDRAELTFGESWGGSIAVVRADEGNPYDGAVLVPVENLGRRDGSISAASWAFVDENGSLTSDTWSVFVRPAAEWTGRGDLTVPAGARRNFLFPIGPAAKERFDGGSIRMHVYMRQVGQQESVRGLLDDTGIRPLPWTAKEQHEAKLHEEGKQDEAHYEESQARH